MKLPSLEEAMFSLKCFAGAISALYLSYSIGLPRPFWAMTTAYVVSQPWSGAVRSKAVYRLGGTFFGSAMTVYTVPRLANYPVLMTLAMVLWVGLCLYIAVLDRTPRSYLFMLAGYTAAMIGFPSVSDPATVFDTALARVEEISLGIICATLAHSLVFPRGIGRPLMGRLDATVRDARSWIQEVIKRVGERDEKKGAKDRRTLANDITQLRLMATHVPFDTGNIRWTANALAAMQDHIIALTPAVSAVEDRLQALAAAGRELPPPVRAVMDEISAWMDNSAHATREQAVRLRAALTRLAPAIQAESDWDDALLTSLVVRLRELVDTYDACLALRLDIRAGLQGKPRISARRLTRGPALHRDHGLALLSALAAGLAISVCCLFWIGTAWSNGATAALMAAIFSCFFAAQDDPVPGIMQFLTYTIYSIPLSALYLLGIMPAVHSFEMLALSLFPVAFVTGIFLARPTTAAKAMAVFFGLTGTLALHDTNTADLVSFLDTTLAQCIGVALAAIIAAVFRTVSVEWSARRLQSANWKELAALAGAHRVVGRQAFAARLLDRIGLLQPRLAMAKRRDDQLADDALKDLRVGKDIAELQRARRHLPVADAAIQPVLRGLAECFRQRLSGQDGERSPALLTHIDRALQSVCATPDSGQAARERAVVALVGIRRAFFPDAQAYRPLMAVQEG
ncbi:FUSC family protein [Bordetella hinzii]|uniref:FUSC family protein n=1 Tax=Bordetella hinzii TaxID=103855 RepID=UPI00041C090E|nr:FUSC family protein [Bordetella hinzii]AKQ55426.1 p-hydroxybenzoic acid efflux pump subunit AaeB [Bordetella hinzii]KCB23082.1 fusaric acid resistance family protein [Bordetella hinzii L60]KCB42027.1 fusaric acid resistance family protein [Bordetella hinzii 4161]KCB51433.1 fusaric acid resistance family protein [Bordetella hinzii 1277]KXA73864.1 fusaric acid resistance protein [Bordetella hinzii LMG 13501]